MTQYPLKTGPKLSKESEARKSRQAFKKRMMELGRELNLAQKIKLDLERLDALQGMTSTTEEELDILKAKFTVYFQLMPYLLPKLASIDVSQVSEKKALSNQEADLKLEQMLADAKQ